MTPDPYYGAMPEPKFKRGQEVFHPWWGRGKVEEVLPAYPPPPEIDVHQNYTVRWRRTGHTDVFDEKNLQAVDPSRAASLQFQRA